jgi:hypothetical protein
MRELTNCIFCGMDTPNKSQICRVCTGGNEHSREFASSDMKPFDEFEGESEYDYTENALGPKQMEDRLSARWTENDEKSRKKKR